MENIQNKSAYDTNTINKCIEVLEAEIETSKHCEKVNVNAKYTQEEHYNLIIGTLIYLKWKMESLRKVAE